MSKANVPGENITLRIGTVSALFIATMACIGSMYGYGQMVKKESFVYTNLVTQNLREYVDAKNDPIYRDLKEIKQKLDEND